MVAPISCQCLSETVDFDDRLDMRDPDGHISLDGLIAVRSRCPALKSVLLPESIWPQFLQWHRHPDDAAAHASMILLAFVRGVLPRITLPIHRYLMAGSEIGPNVTCQYRNDIQEKWMFKKDPVERNKVARIYRGRLAELQFATHLEGLGHRIIGMEATGHNVDIETLSEAGQEAFELKAFGQADEDFIMQMGAMNGEPSGGSVSLPRPVNYLLLRVYEAALQLGSASARRKTAVVVIDELSASNFNLRTAGSTGQSRSFSAIRTIS